MSIPIEDETELNEKAEENVIFLYEYLSINTDDPTEAIICLTSVLDLICLTSNWEYKEVLGSITKALELIHNKRITGRVHKD